MVQFLVALPPEYALVRNQILDSDSLLFLYSIFSCLQSVSAPLSKSKTSVESSALVAGSHDRNSSFNRGRGRSQGGNHGRGTSSSGRKCTYCGRSNHVEKKCWEKYGKPDWANQVIAPELGGAETAVAPTKVASDTLTIS